MCREKGLVKVKVFAPQTRILQRTTMETLNKCHLATGRLSKKAEVRSQKAEVDWNRPTQGKRWLEWATVQLGVGKKREPRRTRRYTEDGRD